MNYQELNKVLSSLSGFRNINKPIKTETIKNIDGEGEQGENGLAYEIYKCPFDKDVFIKITVKTDSYGDNEFIDGVEFVKPVQKQVTSYEAVS